jgi:hypothetical protein
MKNRTLFLIVFKAGKSKIINQHLSGRGILPEGPKGRSQKDKLEKAN